MKIAVIQYDIAWVDRQANFNALRPLINEAAHNGARLIVLPEMFSTGFVVDRDDTGEPIGGPSSAFLSTMAQELNVYIGGSCPEVAPDDPRPFNTFVITSPDGSEHRYSKIHPFTYGGEDKHFRAGQEHVTIDIDGLRTSLFVCYDLRFADEFWACAHNTDIYLVPANWPTARREHWMALLRARAIENQAYVVGCNRVGDGGGLNYSGDSLVIDPLGTVLAQGQSEACILYADIEPAFVSDVRTKYPFLQDRR
ncbi:MAG: carbon-nitrogen family hydrolase [Actinobacteria bacterium]|nr:carbon-nitrogen family hydrolase [Actinomycetota bacterium]